MTVSPVSLRRDADHAPAVHVALIRPPVIVCESSLSVVGPTPPIGLAYIAGSVRAVGHHVQVIDGCAEALDRAERFDTPVGEMTRLGLPPEEIVARIDADVAVIGISNMFLHEWPEVRAIAEAARARFPSACIVMGGDNATAFWSLAFEETEAFDACVLGEGEATMVALVERVANGASLAGLDGVGLARVAEGEVHHDVLPVRMRTLDTVPRPAWDLLPVEAYIDHPSYFGVHRGRSMPILGTRGCPYRCTFCSSPQVWTTRYVVRDPDDVADEIAELVARYQVSNIDFVDLTAATKRSWTLGLCDAIERRAPGISWQLPVGTRSEAFDEEVLRRLYESGCRNVTFAPESGSRRLLEIMQKKVDLDHLLTAVGQAKRVGLVTHANLIIGHPSETGRDRWQTAVLLCRLAWLGCDSASTAMFSAYPGSEDFDRLLAAGLIERSPGWEYDALTRGSGTHPSYNSGISARSLRVVQMAMMCLFYGLSIVRRPSRLVHLWRSQRSGLEHTHLEQFIRTKRRGYHGEAAVPSAGPAPVGATRQPASPTLPPP